MLKLWRRLHRDEDGKLTVEQVLLIAFITLPLLGLLIAFKNRIAEFFNKAADSLFGGAGQ